MQVRWIDRAIKCCGGPIFFYSGLYLLIGVLFIVGSLYLDPAMGHVGIILLLVGVGILLLFFVLAYHKFRGNGRTKDTR
jgi:multisubunit Na+/H+ antiporter MnhC subunit